MGVPAAAERGDCPFSIGCTGWEESSADSQAAIAAASAPAVGLAASTVGVSPSASSVALVTGLRLAIFQRRMRSPKRRAADSAMNELVTVIQPMSARSSVDRVPGSIVSAARLE